MVEPRYIKNWSELKSEFSETHTLEINEELGCGRIRGKNGKDSYYLSTHTFYGRFHQFSTELLQSCGFNVILDNWDKTSSK